MEFDVIQSFKGPEAWAVTGTDGKCIQGVRLLKNYNRSFNSGNKSTFRQPNVGGRRRRNTNLNRDDGSDGETETKPLKAIPSETDLEINAKGDSSNGNDKG